MENLNFEEITMYLGAIVLAIVIIIFTYFLFKLIYNRLSK